MSLSDYRWLEFQANINVLYAMWLSIANNEHIIMLLTHEFIKIVIYLLTKHVWCH